MHYKSIGKSIPRVDSVAKVTGAASFTADIRFPRELFGKVVRSSQPHALIKKIDFQKALEIPGVKGVVIGENSHETVGVCIQDQPPIARGKVRFVGEPVAVVVAQSKEIAWLAARFVTVEYEPLKAVFESEEAMAKNAPLLHDRHVVLPGFLPEPGSNVFHHYQIRMGNFQEVLERSSFSVSGEMHWPHLAHCQMEPHVTIAKWGVDDRLEIHTSAQSPFDIRHFVGKAFHLPLKDIGVTTHYVGGGFGGKSDATIEPLAVFVARHFKGEYVRIQLEREDMFPGTVVGRGLDGYFTVAFDEKGTIQAMKSRYILNSGGYASYAINIVQPGGIATTGTYRIEHLEIDAYGVYTNLPPLGAYRAYGHPEAALTVEKAIELVAEKLGLSPMEIRRRNLIRPGHLNSVGQKVRTDDGNIEECMALVEKDIVEHQEMGSKEKHFARGTGFANFLKAPGMPTNGFSSAIVKLNDDATATVLISGVDMGQGLLTTITQIAAESLNLPISRIEVTPVPDTRYTPYEWQTVASRSTWMVGNAVHKACEDAIAKIKGNGALALGVPAEEIFYDGEKVFWRFDAQRSVPVSRLMMGHSFANGRTVGVPPVGYGAYVPEMEYPDPKTGQGNVAAQWTYGCQGVVLDVDLRTGEILPRLISSALDIGKVINPVLAKGQVEGGVVMGIGGAILESIMYQKGKIRNPEFTDYKIPMAEDVIGMKMITHFVETHDQKMVYGAKCLAEHPIIGIAPAILAAVFDATGLHFDRLPLTADVVREKIRQNYDQVIRHTTMKRASHVSSVPIS